MSRIEFSTTTKRQAHERARGVCGKCGLPLQAGRIQYDHILPLALGGKSELANCMVLCAPCHTEKTAREDVPRIRKADRQKAVHVGAKRPAGNIRSPGFARRERPEKLPLPPARSLYEDRR